MLGIFLLPLVGAVIVTVIGTLWYGPIFGKAYMRAMGVNPEMAPANKKGMIGKVVLDFVMTFILLFGFLNVMNFAYAGTYSAAFIFALLFWFFIVMPMKASSAIWSGRDNKSSWTLFGLGAGYSLVSFAIAGPLFIWLIGFFVK